MPALPYAQRTSAHTAITEGIAMLFERVCGRSACLRAMGIEVSHPESFDELQMQQQCASLLLFSRWCEVTFHLEQAMYADPQQNLRNLWWDLVERYQMLSRPPRRDAPDYACLIHWVDKPVSHHNYLLGQLFASQLHASVCHEVLNAAPQRADYVHKSIGAFMRDRVYCHGSTLSWQDLTIVATGKPLGIADFTRDCGI